jgi:hypothetical protein
LGLLEEELILGLIKSIRLKTAANFWVCLVKKKRRGCAFERALLFWTRETGGNKTQRSGSPFSFKVALTASLLR